VIAMKFAGAPVADAAPTAGVDEIWKQVPGSMTADPAFFG